MIALHAEYLIDSEGHKKAVQIPYDEWEQILEQLEDQDDVEAYDEAKAHESELVPFEEVLERLKSGAC